MVRNIFRKENFCISQLFVVKHLWFANFAVLCTIAHYSIHRLKIDLQLAIKLLKISYIWYYPYACIQHSKSLLRLRAILLYNTAGFIHGYQYDNLGF